MISLRLYYRPQRSWGKVIFSEACVKNCVHRGGLPHCMLGYTPPPRTDTPQDQRQTPREQTPPSAVHAGRYGQQAGSTHPTGMHTCLKIGSTTTTMLPSQTGTHPLPWGWVCPGEWVLTPIFRPISHIGEQLVCFDLVGHILT